MKKHLVLALLLAAAPFAASAGELSYTYVEGGFSRLSVDTDQPGIGDVDFDGFQLRGSVAVAESIYLFGGYGSGTNDDFGGDIDVEELQFGVGYRHGLSDRADLVAEAGYLGQEIEAGGFSEEGNGGRVSVGVRGLLADNFEGWVKGNYTDGGDFDGDFSAGIGAQFKFNQTWGLVGDIEAGDDASKYTIGVRASF